MQRWREIGVSTDVNAFGTLPALRFSSGKGVYPLVDASRAAATFVTSTMRNRALPCIIRA